MICDWCLADVDLDEPAVSILYERERYDQKPLGHYHAEPCWPEMAERIKLIHDAAGGLAGLPAAASPVYMDPEGGAPILDEYRGRLEAGTPLVELLATSPCEALRRANLVTVEEVAGRTREEIEALSGVGRGTMEALDQEMKELGLAFRRGAIPGLAIQERHTTP